MYFKYRNANTAQCEHCKMLTSPKCHVFLQNVNIAKMSCILNIAMLILRNVNVAKRLFRQNVMYFDYRNVNNAPC
jgi:hypothetical protein